MINATLAYIIASLPGGMMLTEGPIPCTGENMDSLAQIVVESGLPYPDQISCEYTFAPIESVTPKPRPKEFD